MDKVGEYTLTVIKKAKWYNKWLLSIFEDCLNGEILEVGAGIGNFTSLLSEYGTVTAIDVNKVYVNKIKKAKYGEGDIEKGRYFFKNRKFDCVVCLNVIEHIKDDDKAVENIHKLLKKDGVLVLMVPAHGILFGNYDRLLGHYRRYSVKGVNILLEKSGFKLNRTRYINWWGALGWLVFIKLFNRSKFPDKEVGVFNYFGKFLLWPEKIIKLPFGLSVLAVAKKQ